MMPKKELLAYFDAEKIDRRIDYDFTKPQLKLGEDKNVTCGKCGTANTYLWIPSRFSQTLVSGSVRIVPSRIPAKAINCRCRLCGDLLRNEIAEETPGAKILDNNMSLVDKSDKEYMEKLKVTILEWRNRQAEEAKVRIEVPPVETSSDVRDVE